MAPKQRPKLDLDPAAVRQARRLARQAGKPIVDLAKKHTTVSVERATLRLAGLQGADADGTPWVNRLLDAVRADVGIEHGVALPVWDALVRGEADDLSVLAQKASAGSVRFRLPEGRDETRARSAARKAVGAGVRRMDARRKERERLDMMLNDSMYGILFRDINPIRTFVDQRFSRQVHARAGIIINTGEDNYLTTADAVEAAHTVTVSQLLNEYFAKEAGLEDWQLGLGHAFEINPDLPDSFRMELAHALLARQLFPNAPLKWMPPTRHMTGDVFRGYMLDAFFNLVGTLTGQGILLVGMMTEAVVTPWLSDRDLALQNVRYVLNAAGNLHEDFQPAPDGFINQRARQVLAESIDLLERILAHESKTGLLDAIADGTFGLMKRPADGGRGLDGVARKSPAYYNPASEILEEK